MDPALAMELKALALQEPMNAVIDRGDSAVQQFYCGATVFLTGGSGFIGKQLIEKLFRSCAIKKMYVLLRSKTGKTTQERLQTVLEDPVFDLVRAKQPAFADKIVPVEGDVAELQLGLSSENWTTLTKEVNSIFHAAATVRFDAPLRAATLTNVRATRESLTLARACSNLKSYVYVSTAYAAATKERIGTEVYEEFYPSPVSPAVLISLAEDVEEERLDRITENFIKGWPNTYTFTKAVAEEQIRSSAKDLPICVVRPPIVVAAYYEPLPGWIDLSAVMGPSGIVLAVLLGVLHVFRVDRHAKLPDTPVDYVNNAIIAAGWDAQQRRDDGDICIPIYTVSNKKYFIEWNFVGKRLRDSVEMASDKAVYLCSLLECKHHQVYWLLSFLLHYIPAYILDIGCTIVGKRPKGIKSFVGIYSKMDKMAKIYDYFTSNEWGFRDDNVKAMLSRMSAADRAIYNCDLSNIDFAEYVQIWGIGIRKYIIKDGLNNSALGYKKQKIFRILNYIVLPLYLFILWSVLRLSINIGRYAVNIII